MALFHLSVTQVKRSAGQSAIASAAYRAGERLYSERYGEYSDYTRKGGVICSDILPPPQAPPLPTCWGLTMGQGAQVHGATGARWAISKSVPTP